MRLTKGSKTATGSPSAGINTLAGNAKRPPKMRKGVANDLYPDKPRSAVMPPPTKDTGFKRSR